MRRPRQALALATLLGALGLAWSLWPVADPRWTIAADPAAAERARRFLDAATTAPARERPNVVVIVADDLGKYDTSLYGVGPVPTPNLVRLADGGVRFTTGYVTSPVCSPSRAALLTGRYGQRFGFELLTHDRYPRNRLEWWAARAFFSTHGWHALAQPTTPTPADMERQGLPPSEITLAQLLRKEGYRTGIFGKWHLGFGSAMRPEAKGFETQYGFYDAFALPVSALDVFATAARATGATVPTDRVYDGVDLLPFVTGARAEAPHAALFCGTGGHQAVRAGDYKLIVDDRTGARVLYDLARDPSEHTDLAAAEPERSTALARLLEQWVSELTPPLWPPAMEYRFTLGGKHFVFPL